MEVIIKTQPASTRQCSTAKLSSSNDETSGFGLWKGCDIKMSDIGHEFQGSGDWSFCQRADEIVHALLLCNSDEKVRTLQQEFLCKITEILPGMYSVLDNEPSIKVLTQVLSIHSVGHGAQIRV